MITHVIWQSPCRGARVFRQAAAVRLLTGIARTYHETLKPRVGEHLVVINATGVLDDGRRFDFHVKHVEDQTKSIQLEFR